MIEQRTEPWICSGQRANISIFLKPIGDAQQEVVGGGAATSGTVGMNLLWT